MPERETPIRRIMVALDASPPSLSALQTAVDLAARFGSELAGLFVEDINLLRVARLPFVREVGALSHAVRRLEPEAIERQLRRQAERMRQSLAQAAEVRGVAWTFQVKRGSVALEVMAASADADLMIMGRAGRSLAAYRRMGSTARTMVLQRPGMLLVLTRSLPANPAVTVLYDGSAVGRKAVAIARAMGWSGQRPLSVILVAENREEAAALREEVLQQFAAAPEVRTLLQPSPAALAWLVQMSSDGPVVLPCGRERLQGDKLCSLVDALPNPVLVVR